MSAFPHIPEGKRDCITYLLSHTHTHTHTRCCNTGNLEFRLIELFGIGNPSERPASQTNGLFLLCYYVFNLPLVIIGNKGFVALRKILWGSKNVLYQAWVGDSIREIVRLSWREREDVQTILGCSRWFCVERVWLKILYLFYKQKREIHKKKYECFCESMSNYRGKLIFCFLNFCFVFNT